jgi:hypothetical protein
MMDRKPRKDSVLKRTTRNEKGNEREQESASENSYVYVPAAEIRFDLQH